MYPKVHIQPPQRNMQQESILLEPRDTLEPILRRPCLMLGAVDRRWRDGHLEHEIPYSRCRPFWPGGRDERSFFPRLGILRFFPDGLDRPIAADRTLHTGGVPPVKHAESDTVLLDGFVAVRAAFGRDKVFLLRSAQGRFVRRFGLQCQL
jgi:hypothetical protein